MKDRLLRSVVWGVLGVCALAASIGAGLAGAEDQKAKVLIALDDDWSKAAVARNVDQVASFYADDGVAYPPNEPVAAGRAAARAVWARYFYDPTYQVSWKTTAAGVENNMGWTAGTYQESFQGPDGKTVVGKGKYLCVWRKGADGKWKAIQDMWNSDTK